MPAPIAMAAEKQRPTSHPALLSSGEPQAPPFSIAVPIWDSSYNWRHTPRDLLGLSSLTTALFVSLYAVAFTDAAFLFTAE